ncbi:MAG: TetR/AcrR family transcriptional regulator, partial [Desulfatibacillaceae bacterium]|nr:TetR/AcrR family transcriptional regulator [Desulfatibacillaceae bacterium]
QQAFRTGQEEGYGPSKGQLTQEKILSASRQVFTEYPFHAASLRNISEIAGIRHPLIVHYFGSKAALFEEVARLLEAEILGVASGFIAALEEDPSRIIPRQTLETFVNYAFAHPDPFKAIMLNLGNEPGVENALPGLGRMVHVREKATQVLCDRILGGAGMDEADMFLFAVILSVAHFVGAQAFHSQVLGISNEKTYQQWVLENLALVLGPVADALGQGRGKDLNLLVEGAASLAALDTGPEGPAPNPAQASGSENRITKGEKTRARIIAAGRKVFATHAFNAASIRQIGKVGKFDFTHIHHFYPSKESLFEAVARDVFESFTAAARQWGQGLNDLPVEQVFAIYIKRALDYCFDHGEALGILMHNVAQFGRFKTLSGFEYMAAAHTRIWEIVGNFMPRQAPEESIRSWLYTIITLVYSFTGAPLYPARMMGTAPNSAYYRQRIFQMLTFVFVPSLLEMSGEL